MAMATTVPARAPRATKLISEHDADRLPQRGGEFADREIHRQGLIGHQTRLDAVRQLGSDVGDGVRDIAPERQGIAAVAHGDGEPDGGFPVDAEHGLGRIGEAAANIGDVAQPQHALADGERDLGDVPLGPEGARDPQRDGLVAGAKDARRADDVLGAQRGDQGAGIEPQPGEPLGREIDIDDFVLGSEDVDLGDVGDREELRTGVLHGVAQFAMREAIGGEGVDDSEGVAELVVEKGSDDPLRQGVAHVADLFAHLVPAVRNVPSLRAPDQIDENGGGAGTGEAAQVVEIRNLLQGAFETLGDLRDGLVEGGAGPDRLDHHGAEGERRIFRAAELVKGAHPGGQHREHDENGDRAVADGPIGEIEAAHGRSPIGSPAGSPSRRTC
jgi:hypothetical protein